jgi:membrane protein DedA with SNARE-associated domain
MFDPHFQNHFREIGFLMHSIRGLSYFGIFLLSAAVSYIIPIPEIVVLILFGYAAGTGNLNIAYVLLASASGSIVGDNIIYRLSLFGNKYVEKFNQKMRESKLIKYEYLVKDNIGKSIYFLRFIAGVRFFGPVIAGTLGVRWKRFLPFNGSATLINTAFFVMLGYYFHHRVVPIIIEAEVVRNILLFSSVFIVGILVAIFSKNQNQK